MDDSKLEEKTSEPVFDLWIERYSQVMKSQTTLALFRKDQLIILTMEYAINACYYSFASAVLCRCCTIWSLVTLYAVRHVLHHHAF